MRNEDGVHVWVDGQIGVGGVGGPGCSGRVGRVKWWMDGRVVSRDPVPRLLQNITVMRGGTQCLFMNPGHAVRQPQHALCRVLIPEYPYVSFFFLARVLPFP